MVSDNSSPAVAEEPLLGAAPALDEESWGQMLQSAFDAPPGFADNIVDVFETPESTDDTIDADDYATNFEDIAGGEGQAGTQSETADDTIIDSDLADAEPASTAASDASEPWEDLSVDQPGIDQPGLDDFAFGEDDPDTAELDTDEFGTDDAGDIF